VTVVIRQRNSKENGAERATIKVQRPEHLRQGELNMINRNNSLVLAAAFTGLLGGTMARLSAAPSSSGSNPTVSSIAGDLATTSNAEKEKHACQGKNSCKGKGGCKTSDNGCKGKNSCKGKGGCATDGSKMK
jgi:hypothetical protein